MCANHIWSLVNAELELHLSGTFAGFSTTPHSFGLLCSPEMLMQANVYHKNAITKRAHCCYQVTGLGRLIALLSTVSVFGAESSEMT